MGSSEEGSPWTKEDFSALQAERSAVEEELLEHLADQDATQLKWRAVSRLLLPNSKLCFCCKFLVLPPVGNFDGLLQRCEGLVVSCASRAVTL